MSGKAIRTAVVILAGTLCWPVCALAFEPPYFFVDPLGTLPEVVEKGVVLPGDTAPIPSSVSFDGAHPLALAEAVDLALCNNSKIKSAWAEIKIQAGAVGEARAAYLPVLTGAVGRTNDQIRYSDPRYMDSNVDRTTGQVSATWRIFDFGGRSANRQAAERLLAAALANHNAILQRALGAVIQAYFDAVTADAALKAKGENEELARDILASAKAREARGVIAQGDTLRATTTLARATLEKNRAQGENRKALAVLSQIIGLPVGTEIVLPQELREEGGEPQQELGRWLAEAQKNHPAIVAVRDQLEAAQQQLTAARAAGLPTVNLTGNYYQNTRPGEAVTTVEAKETTVGVMLSIPIFDGFSSTYKVRGAQAQVEQKEAALADMEQQIAVGVINAYADAVTALSNLDASVALLDAGQKALAVVQRKYDKGAADLTELLSTQAALADARQERVRCLADWRSARLRLLASAGQLGRAAVGK